MKANPLILTFDVGTQSMRGMIIDSKGKIVALEQYVYEVPYVSIKKDWAEKDPHFYYEVLCKISSNLKKKHKDLFENIIAITTTTFRDSTICLDDNNQPLRDMILWLDKREIDEDELPIPKYKQWIFKLVGVWDTVLMQHRQSVCNYIMVREPEIWNKTKKYVVLSTYLNYMLTGNLIDSGANQIAHVPFDYKKVRWSSKNDLTRCIYDVPEDKLCDLCDPGSQIGGINKKCAKDSGIKEGTPVIVTGSDKGCETVGLSVIGKNKAAVSFGTSATIQFSTPDYYEPKPFCPSYPSPIKGIYNGEVQVYRGYWMLTWFKKNFASLEETIAKKQKISIEEYFNKHLKDVPAGCDGLILQPFWSPGVANPNAKGAMIGWSDIHTKYHMYRAIIEGINFEIMDGLYTMSKRSNQTIKEVFVGGGGSKSDEICQITANMLGLPVKRIQTHEACGLGSSIIGFVSMGIYDDIEEAINNMVSVKDNFEPDIKEHNFYLHIYKDVYKNMGKKLEPFYKSYKRIMKGSK